MEIKINIRVAYGLFAAFLVLASFCAALFGAPQSCDIYHDCGSLLTLWRGIVVVACLVGTIPVLLFGVFRIHE